MTMQNDVFLSFHLFRYRNSLFLLNSNCRQFVCSEIIENFFFAVIRSNITRWKSNGNFSLKMCIRVNKLRNVLDYNDCWWKERERASKINRSLSPVHSSEHCIFLLCLSWTMFQFERHWKCSKPNRSQQNYSVRMITMIDSINFHLHEWQTFYVQECDSIKKRILNRTSLRTQWPLFTISTHSS